MGAALSRGGGLLLWCFCIASCSAAPPPAEPPLTLLILPAPVPAPLPSTAPVKVAPPADSPLAERLAAISVRKRLPDLAKKHDEVTPGHHAVSLALVAEAIERVGPEMLVRYRESGGEATPILEFQLTDAGHFPTYPDGEVSAGWLKKYGGATYLGYVSGQTSYVLSYNVEPKPLPDGSPGLVWDVDVDDGEAQVSFVSLDGETYGLEGTSLELGAGDPASWPPPASSPAFGRMSFTVARRPMTRNLDAADEAVLKCAEQARKRMTDEQIGKDPAIEAGWIRTHCHKPIVAWEKAFAQIIEDSVAARTALVERAKTRLLAATAPGGSSAP